MKDNKVERYLCELELVDLEKFETLQLIRNEVKRIYPNIDERMMYGGIMFSIVNEDLGGVFVRKNHISVEFTSGNIMDDPNKKLEGNGKFRRHVKIKDKSEIVAKELTFFIKQMR